MTTQYIKNLQKKLGITQSELGRRLGYKESTFSNKLRTYNDKAKIPEYLEASVLLLEENYELKSKLCEK